MGKKLTIGRIVAPHGVRGDVRIVPLTENPQRFFEMQSLKIQDVGSFEIENIRWHKQFLLTKLSGIETMDDAEKLRNKEIEVTLEELGAPPEGRYYVFDMLGMDVFNVAGEKIGVLKEVLDTGAADVYVIKLIDSKKDMLVPAIKSVVKEIDIDNKKMIIEPQVWED